MYRDCIGSDSEGSTVAKAMFKLANLLPSYDHTNNSADNIISYCVLYSETSFQILLYVNKSADSEVGIYKRLIFSSLKLCLYTNH